MKNLIKTSCVIVALSLGTSAFAQSSPDYVPSVDLKRQQVSTRYMEQISWNQISGYIDEVDIVCDVNITYRTECVPWMITVDTELGYFKLSADPDIEYNVGDQIIIELDVRGVD